LYIALVNVYVKLNMYIQHKINYNILSAHVKCTWNTEACYEI